VFEDFRVESRTDNVITTELLLTNMAHALKPGAAAHSVTIKLTKRGSVPYLTLEMDVRARAQREGCALHGVAVNDPMADLQPTPYQACPQSAHASPRRLPKPAHPWCRRCLCECWVRQKWHATPSPTFLTPP
jgi:hypothetical protein